MPHRLCVGKLEGKLFRNYCYMHSVRVPIDRKDPDSPTETVFVGTLEEALFQGESEYISKVAKTEKEICTLIEAGFEYVTEFQGSKIFKKRKQ
jgi:hypothetical protein